MKIKNVEQFVDLQQFANGSGGTGARILKCSPQDRAEGPRGGEILIFGNNPVTALDIEEMLRECRCPAARVVSAVPGEIPCGGDRDPVLMIVDADAGANGSELHAAKSLLAQFQVPVILLSGSLEDANTTWAASTDSLRILKKPFREHELLWLVSEVLAVAECCEPQ